LRLPQGRFLAGHDGQWLEDGQTVLTRVVLPSMGLTAAKLEWAGPAPPARTDLPEVIETTHYAASIDPGTGALVSLKLKPAAREMLGGPANVVLAEQKGDPHAVPEQAKRTLLASSSQFKPLITTTTGRLATIVEVRSAFHGGGELRRVIRFHNGFPRIDFLTETNGLPDGTILSVEFPLAEKVAQMRRGIPYGFSHGEPDNEVPGVTGLCKGILPAIRWTDYAFGNGAGLAILDRGVPARELVGHTAILLLHNVCDSYYARPTMWMADRRKQAYGYALLPHAQDFAEADIARMAWEYNCPVLASPASSVPAPESFVETSANVIVEALRREEGQIELRLVECLGTAGRAWIKVDLPHTEAALTSMLGGNRTLLGPGPQYSFDLRAQQIVTIRLHTKQAAPAVEALRSFESVVPPAKRDYMRSARNPQLVGHPPKKP